MSLGSAWRQGLLGGSAVGMLVFMTSCGSQDPGTVATDPPQSSALPTVAIAPPSDSSQPAPFETSMVPSTATLPPPLPAPQLIPPTSSNAQVTLSSAGRPDPFAPLPPSNVVVTARPKATTPTIPPAPLLPVAPAAPLPAISVPASPIPVQPPSATPPPAAPAPVQKPLAETIEISGFLEVGGAASLIVSVPGEPTSRPARVGDYLGNGNVLIKQVMPQPSGEVLVILEQDGVEYQRQVGSNPASLVGSL